MKCENCGAPISKKDKTCPYCNQENPHYDDSCLNEIEKVSEIKENDNHKNKKKKNILVDYVIPSIFIIFIIVFQKTILRNIAIGKVIIVIAIIILAIALKAKNDVTENGEKK